MSKPRYGWWPYVKDMIRRYPDKVTEEENTAVLRAVSETEALIDGEDRMKIIRMVFFKKTHTLQGAAMNVPCSYETAKRWTQQFILLVAKNFVCSGLVKD